MKQLYLFLFVGYCLMAGPILYGQTSISGIINTYTSVTAISTPACGDCDAACTHTITVNDVSGLAVGDKALIIQMKGADINTANTAGSGNVTAINNAGNYEFFEIGEISGNVLTPKYPLIRDYTVAGIVQVVRIPDYDDAVINGSLTSLDWDDAAGIGGVVALQARKLTFGADIEVQGRGYQGIQMPINGTPDNCNINPNAQYVLPSTDNSSYTKGDGIVVNDNATNRGRAPRANGGGSGVSGDSGGGGGSNYGAGGAGGWRWCDEQGPQDGTSPEIAAGGEGGYALATFLAQDKVFMGGAGGPGWVSTNNPSTAADGGGIVIIFADTIIGNNHVINAFGLSPTAVNPVGAPDGGGGGGAGGSVVLKTTTYIGDLTINVNGGDGQDLNTNNYHGPGGGGGGGVLLYSLSALPANVTIDATGGVGGVHSDGFRNGTADGTVGGTISLYVPIQNPNYEGNVDDDLISTACDIDDDNDGIPDVVDVYNRDHDNDGIPDYADPDFCAAFFQGVNGWNCGTDNLPDPSNDMDNDGIPNFKDVDFPYCGGLNSNGACINMDADGDGSPNHLDLDSDNDGIPDIIEAGGTDTNGDGFIDDNTDTDGDGLADDYDNDDTDGPLGTSACATLPNCLQTNSTSLLFDKNNDGIYEVIVDTDGDGLPDYLDLDADNDGIPDVVEAGGTDVNGDGYVDNYFDSDGDGFNDVVDGRVCEDSIAITTGNGTAVVIDNGITNEANALGNPDGAVAELHQNNDVLGLDLGQVLPAGTVITVHWRLRNTGTANLGVGLSTAVGGPFVNQLVSPSTTSLTVIGTSEIVTTAASQYIRIFDAGGDDFQVDAVTWEFTNTFTLCDNGLPLILTGTDTDNDGAPNSYVNGDFDGDGNLNHLDLDADNDGIQDILEAYGVDVDGDGMVDSYTDSDNDGYHDPVDGDVGNDFDSENTANALVVTGTDSDNDGRPNDYPAKNADNNGNPNFLDLDSDDDGITDVVENASGTTSGTPTTDSPSGADIDGEIEDGAITDANANGWSDTKQGSTIVIDTDGDGIPDPYDIDADNDGIPDFLEGTCSTCPTFANPSGSDLDGNGVLDMYETLQFNNQVGGANIGITPNEDDNDGANPPDYLDIDSDNDTGMDWAEGFDNGFGGGAATAADGNASQELVNMATAYVTNGGLATDYPATDTDGDGLPDWLDNLNGFGYTNNVHPPFLDASSIYWIDRDNDGLADLLDSDVNGVALGTLAPVPDNDGINDHDWRDITAYVDFPVEMLYFNAKRVNDALVKLDWATASEENNKGFFVERMLEHEEDFIQIGWVDGSGTVTQTTYYTENDENAYTGISYYRLRQVDFDGSETLTEIKAVEGIPGSGASVVRVYPIPFKDQLNIRFEELPAQVQTAQLRVIGVNGQLIQDLEIQVAPWELVQLNQVSDWPAGQYILQLQLDNGSTFHQKVIKQ